MNTESQEIELRIEQIREQIDEQYQLIDSVENEDIKAQAIERVSELVNEMAALVDELEESLGHPLDLHETISDEGFEESLLEQGLIDEDYDGDFSEFYPPDE